MSAHEKHHETHGSCHYHDANEQDVHDSQNHIVSPLIYLIVGGILLVMTGVTVWASYLELGVFNPIVALAIACFKATIVVLFFMHVKYSSKLTKLSIGAGLFMFLTLISLTLTDYLSRAWGRW